jgi:exodeoxyribonuclease VII large subunit
MIESLGPLSVLRRGYSVSRQNERVLKSVEDIDLNENMEIRYADGYVISRPLKKERFDG